jgi:DNA-binding NarL/FixJ family response regulator
VRLAAEEEESGPRRRLRAVLAARRVVPGLPVLVLSQHVEQLYAQERLAEPGGGVGYLLEDRVGDVTEFVDAVRRVAGGRTVMDGEGWSYGAG